MLNIAKATVFWTFKSWSAGRVPVCIEIYIKNKAKSAKTKGNYVNVEVIAALINGYTVERRSEPVFDRI